MKQRIVLGAFVAAGSLLTACPIYPAEDCYDSSDCTHGHVCDSVGGRCLVAVTPPSYGDDDSRTCSSSAQCGSGQTCSASGFCSIKRTGGVGSAGGVNGFNAASGAGGTSRGGAAGVGAGIAGSGGQGGDGGMNASGGSAGASGSFGVYETNGLSLATGLFELIDQDIWKPGVGGISSRPAQSGIALAGGDRDKGELLSLTVHGSPGTGSTTISCNGTGAPKTTCELFARRMLGPSTILYVSNGSPFTVTQTSWTENIFRGYAENVGVTKIVNGSPETYIVARINIEAEKKP